MRPRAHRPQLLDHEPPARRGLQRHLERLDREPRQEAAHPLPIRWRDSRARDLTRLSVEPLRGDLRPMLIQSHHDRHDVSSRRTRRAGSVQPDPSHTVGHRSALRAPNEPAARLLPARAFNVCRSTRRAGHCADPPRPTAHAIFATRRTRSSALCELRPALCPGSVLSIAFSLPRPLPSPASAAGDPALFGGFTGTTSLVAVGTPVTRRPPRRSPHARLTHGAPALGSGVKATVGPGVHDARAG